MEHMSNIFSTSFGINFAKLTRVWLALISLTAKINSLLLLSHPVHTTKFIERQCRKERIGGAGITAVIHFAWQQVEGKFFYGVHYFELVVC